MTNQEKIEAFGKQAIIEVCESQLAVLFEEADLLFNLINHCNSEISQAEDPVVKEMYKGQLAKLSNEQKKIRKDTKYWSAKMASLTEGDRQKYTWDLDAIKQIPITNFIVDPVLQSSTRRHYKAPWRNETKASLVVYTAGNTWWDFGESTGGSNIDFIMKKEGIDFKQAVKFLASYL